jgi:hypothetical protein
LGEVLSLNTHIHSKSFGVQQAGMSPSRIYQGIGGQACEVIRLDEAISHKLGIYGKLVFGAMP